ncbi:copper resistance protein CopC [Actinomadura syzygii]|uniref:Copper resistance protein CopC n=1 Tax=Actinomadura syzygii TaxID=1427538 RepID=A0A5D0UNT6_9ACTN|nr:copper resistance CopC family protein [Actinomadura syzygii]TYC18699.1 copper resistance protein CopC [Actinomadura syzygii]
MTRAAARAGAGVLAVGTVLALSAVSASAHTALTGATPAKNASVASPTQVVLEYSESVRLPKVILSDASGRQYQGESARAVDNKVTQAVPGTLPNGKYTVAWRVVSADGHPVSGTYTFTVKGSPGGAAQPAPPQAQPTPSQAAPSQAGAVSSSDDSGGGSSGWLWIGLIAVVVAAAAGAVALFRRSSAAKD